jgi:hypothetical protein
MSFIIAILVSAFYGQAFAGDYPPGMLSPDAEVLRNAQEICEKELARKNVILGKLKDCEMSDDLRSISCPNGEYFKGNNVVESLKNVNADKTDSRQDKTKGTRGESK